MARQGFTGLVLVLGCGLMLVGCEDGGQPFGFLKGKATVEGTEGPATTSATRLVERDVEAPEIFSVSDQGLWDGRPSLGGVWVAHPAVKDPERVIIRNTTNGKFVIGALFRRERENPGPKTQVSSDAAAALGMLAGQPAALSVVALRRQDVAADPQTKGDPALPAIEKIDTKPLEGPTATPARTPVGATIKPRAKPAVKPRIPAPPAPTTPPAASDQSYIQIGIFSVEANAKEAAGQLSAAGISSAVKTETSQGKTFWRVLAGPMAETDRDARMTTIKGLGYPDAYTVSN